MSDSDGSVGGDGPGSDDVAFFEEHGAFSSFLASSRDLVGEGPQEGRRKRRKREREEAQKRGGDAPKAGKAARRREADGSDGSGSDGSEGADSDGSSEGGDDGVEAAYEARRRAASRFGARGGAGGPDDEGSDDDDGVAPGAAPRLPVKSRTGEVTMLSDDEGASKAKSELPSHRLAMLEAAKRAKTAQAAAEDEEAAKDAEQDGAGSASGSDSEESSGSDSDDSEARAKGGPAGYYALSNADKRVRRERRKIEIAACAEQLMEAPEKHVHQSGKGANASKNTLMALHDITGDEDVAVARLAMLSELAVLRDILPGYRIRLPTEKELAQKASKEVRKQRNYERALLQGYQRFLKFLDITANGAHRGGMEGAEAEDAAADEDSRNSAPRTAVQRHALALTAVTCMCELLVQFHFFNFRGNLLVAVLSRANHKADDVSARCCKALRTLYIRDVDGASCLEAVRSINKLMKAKLTSVRPEVIATLVHLPLVSGLVGEKKPWKPRSRKKKSKKLTALGEEDEAEVQAGLREADAVNEGEKRKNQLATVRELMLVYFRVLRGKAGVVTRLLPPVLDGLSKFAHLIDVGVVLDLLELLRDTLDNEKLPTGCGIGAVLTALRVLSGPGKTLAGDETYFSEHLHRLLLRLVLPDGTEHVLSALECLDALLVRRREYRTETVAAFIKRLFVITPHLPPNYGLATLTCARDLLQRYPATQQILDSTADRTMTSTYVADEDQPDKCNALSASAFELAAIANHYHPELAAVAAATARGERLSAPTSLRRLVEGFDASTGGFNPPIKPAQKHPLMQKSKARGGVVLPRPVPATPMVRTAEQDVGDLGDLGSKRTSFAEYFAEVQRFALESDLVRMRRTLAQYPAWVEQKRGESKETRRNGDDGGKKASKRRRKASE